MPQTQETVCFKLYAPDVDRHVYVPGGCLSLTGSWEIVSGQSGMPSNLPGGLPAEGRARTLSLWPRSADSVLVPLVFMF